MNLLEGKIRSVYFRYLASAFGGALILCIYSLVDAAAVGQYHGPSGTAAMSVIMPVFNIIYGLGMLAGTGGSVLYAAQKGKKSGGEENMFFSASFLCAFFFALASFVLIWCWEEPLLRLFGAEGTLLMLTKEYLYTLRLAVPAFVFGEMLAAFLRNDNAPGLATAAVLGGGIFNIFGDWFFVFKLDMGIRGAGLATSLGGYITLFIMLSHFISPSNTLRLVKPRQFFQKAKQLLATGFSTFFADLAVGIVTMLFNRQILRYLGTDALAVYGVIVQICLFVQCCAYSVGQAAQPILSINYGAANWKRIRETLKYALYAAGFFGIFWTGMSCALPNVFVYIFMKPTQEVLRIAPGIIRCYGISFLLLPFNIFSTYYFQSLMKTKISFLISVGRGAVVSGALILLLPLFRAEAIWLAMPLTEGLVAVYVVGMMISKGITFDTRCIL